MFGFLYSLINKHTVLKIKKINDLSKTPVKADLGCAGYDLFSVEEVFLDPGTRKLIRTGISVEFSKDYYLRIAPRSGLSIQGIDIGAGVIDSSYRGEIKVLLINNSKDVHKFTIGNKIAQFIVERCADPVIEIADNLTSTDRGANGFGSTGN
jgi:dUTP pyrophosphatase